MKKFITFVFVLLFVHLSVNGSVLGYRQPNEFSCRFAQYTNICDVRLKNETTDNAFLYSFETSDLNTFLKFWEINPEKFKDYLNSSEVKKERVSGGKYNVVGFVYAMENENPKTPYKGYVVSKGKHYYFLDKSFLLENSKLNKYLKEVNDYVCLYNEYVNLYNRFQVLEKEKVCSFETWKQVYRNDYISKKKEEYEKKQKDIYTDEVDSLIRELKTIVLGRKLYVSTLESDFEEVEKKFKNSDYEKVDKYLSCAEWYLTSPNSAGGCDFCFTAKNNSKKTIKYLYITAKYKNAVNDFVSCEIRGYNFETLKMTGPYEYGDSMYPSWDNVIYNYSARTAVITSLKIQYMDNTSVTISSSDLIKYQKQLDILDEMIKSKNEIEKEVGIISSLENCIDRYYRVYALDEADTLLKDIDTELNKMQSMFHFDNKIKGYFYAFERAETKYKNAITKFDDELKKELYPEYQEFAKKQEQRFKNELSNVTVEKYDIFEKLSSKHASILKNVFLNKNSRQK